MPAVILIFRRRAPVTEGSLWYIVSIGCLGAAINTPQHRRNTYSSSGPAARIWWYKWKNWYLEWEGKNERSSRPLGRVMRRDNGYEGRVSDSMCDGGLMVDRFNWELHQLNGIPALEAQFQLSRGRLSSHSIMFQRRRKQIEWFLRRFTGPPRKRVWRKSVLHV